MKLATIITTPVLALGLSPLAVEPPDEPAPYTTDARDSCEYAWYQGACVDPPEPRPADLGEWPEGDPPEVCASQGGRVWSGRWCVDAYYLDPSQWPDNRIHPDPNNCRLGWYQGWCVPDPYDPNPLDDVWPDPSTPLPTLEPEPVATTPPTTTIAPAPEPVVVVPVAVQPVVEYVPIVWPVSTPIGLPLPV